ncbi:hypothetical protein HHI36_002444, partial [Cryptolaemus montrouzieri]
MPSSMSYQHETSNTGEETCNLFAKSYKSVFDQPRSNKNSQPIASGSGNHEGDNLSFIESTQYEVKKCLDELDPNKASGSDGLPSYSSRACSSSLSLPLTHLFEKSLRS